MQIIYIQFLYTYRYSHIYHIYSLYYIYNEYVWGVYIHICGVYRHMYMYVVYRERYGVPMCIYRYVCIHPTHTLFVLSSLSWEVLEQGDFVFLGGNVQAWVWGIQCCIWEAYAFLPSCPVLCSIQQISVLNPPWSCLGDEHHCQLNPFPSVKAGLLDRGPVIQLLSHILEFAYTSHVLAVPLSFIVYPPPFVTLLLSF